MDNNFNNPNNMNPYTQMPTGQMLVQPAGTPQQNERKKPGFGAGFGAGIATGVFGAFVLGLVVLFAYSMISGRSVQTVATNSNVLDDKTVSKIDELSNYIDEYYYEDYDKDSLKDSMIHGLMEGLDDPYSVYYTADEYKELQISTTGTYYGIGAGLKQDADTKRVTISKVYSGTPSEEAGLKKGDEIVSVDGIDATSEELTDLVNKIRGKEGTTVRLEIRRDDSEDTFTVDVERKNVELPSVEGKMLDNGVAYIQISEFQTNTASQFEDILSGLENQGMKGLIVDLRGNPGGLLTAVTEIVDRLLPAETVGDLPAGTVVYTQDKNGNVQTYGEDDGEQIDCPIVVLVDENSASASEIFAGAMKDYNEDGYIDATLVGKTTFGKGIVQSIFNLSDGDAVKITTSKYYTPNGKNIHGTGIDPDVEVDYEYTGDTDAEYDMQYDVQLQKAIEVMNEKL